MSTHFQVVLLFSLLVCSVLSMTIQKRNLDSNYDTVQHDEDSPAVCKNTCWGDYEMCLERAPSLTYHLLCLEERDNCCKRCSRMMANY